jgi:hypothetical protein
MTEYRSNVTAVEDFQAARNATPSLQNDHQDTQRKSPAQAPG